MSNAPHEFVARADVIVDSKPLQPKDLAVLVDVRIDLPLNAPGQCVLRFFDEDFELMDSATFAVGGEITIKMPSRTNTMEQVFLGEIVSIGAEQGPNRLTELLITAYDLGHRLGRTSQGRTFLHQKYSDVVTAIANECGLKPKVSMRSTVEFPYLLQTGDNASFLSETARRTGANWKVVGKELNVFDPPMGTTPSATVSWDEGSLLAFRTRFSGSDWNSDVSVRGWDPASKASIVGVGSGPPSILATAPLASDGRSKAKNLGTAKRISRNRVVGSATEAEEMAKAQRAQTASEEVLARGECYGNPAIVPGEMIKVEGMGTRMSGEYYVTEVEHVMSNRGYITRFTAGSITGTSIADLAGERGAGLGVAIGLVSNLQDPDGLGRVKVKFPVYGENLESEWARVVSPAAGADRGFMLMPAVNDEVLIVFEQGDPRRPFVIGGLWNGVDKTPFATDKWLKSGEVVQWGMKTKSGHSLVFDDTQSSSGKVSIVLSDTATKLVLGKDKVELIANSKNLEIKSGQASILLTESGDIEIKGQKVTISAQTDLKLHGQTNLNATSTNVKLAADAKLDLNSNAGTTVGSSAITEVKGTLVKIN